jgi:hypothetical protein
MSRQLHLSPAKLQSGVTQTISAMPNQYPVTFFQAGLLTSARRGQGRPTPTEDYGEMVLRSFCEPRAARDVPAGSLWAFLEHRTMAEIMLDEAQRR